MTESILRICRECGTYTLADVCPAGHGATRTPHPARYSPNDRYAKYRRALFEAAGTGA